MAGKSSTPDFEKSLKALETVVERLENDDLPLDKAVKEWEKGIKLRETCEKILASAEQKVEVLMQAEDDTLDEDEDPFDGDT